MNTTKCLNSVTGSTPLPVFRQIVEAAQEGIWVLDADDCTTYVNQKMCSILEYHETQLTGEKIYHFMNDESGKKLLAELNRTRLGKSGYHDSVIKTKRSKSVWVTISTNAVFDDAGKFSGSVVMMTDISVRKKAEQEMFWLINNTEECFILLNFDLKIVSFNKQFHQLYLKYFGVDVLKGESIVDYAQPERRQHLTALYQRVLEGAEELAEITIPLLNLTPKIFEIKYKPAKDEQGQTIGAFVSLIDITEKRQSEQLVITNEKRYRALIENGTDAIVILTAEGKPLYVSTAVEKVLGYTEEEALQLDLFKLAHPDDQEGIQKLWQKVVHSRGLPIAGRPGRVLHKDGSWRWIEGMLTNMLHDPAIKGIVENFRDVTEKINAEQQKEFEKRDNDALINTTEDLMWSVNSDFKLITANHAFIKVLKLTSGVDLNPGDDLMLGGRYPDGFLDLWGGLYKRALLGEAFIKEVYYPESGIHPESWAETRFNPIYEGHKITGIACYSRDTTAARSFKDKLIRINKKFEMAQQTALLGYWDAELDGDTMSWSDEVYKIWNVSPTSFETTYRNFYNTIHPDDREIFNASQKPAFEGKSKLDVEHRIILPDNSIKYVHEKGELVYNDEGVAVNFEGTVQDITARKIAEDDIKLSELRYRSLIEQATDAICIADQSLKFIDMNPFACRIFGYSKEELLQLSLPDILFSEDLKLNPLNMEEIIAGKSISNERKLKRKDGTAVIMEVSTKMMVDGRFIMFGHDISERKKAELQIKESNKRFDYVTKATSDAIWDWNLVSQTIYWGESLQNIFGYDPKEISKNISSWTDHIHPDDIERVLTGVMAFIDGDGTKWEDQYRYLKKDQTYAYVIDKGFAIRDEMGKGIRMVGAMQDISQRKKAESAFIDALKEKNTILESIGDAFFAVDKNWIVTYWNSRAEKMLHMPKKDIVGHHLWQVFSSSIDSQSYKKYHEAVETKTVLQFEDYYPQLSKWYDITAYPSDNGLSVYFKDVTERRTTEINLGDLNESIQKHAKKLAESNAELEQFAYVASHDLQEPLRMVTGFLTQLEKKYGNIIDEKGKKYIYFAVDGARRMRQIILDLLEYSRVGRKEDSLENIDLNELIKEIQILFRTQIEEKKGVIIADKLPILLTYKSPMRQVFQNLIGNALKYTASSAFAEINISVIEFNNYWQFAVADNGIGIEQEYFDKIFIIFQRLHTKDEFSGTGLGLAVCKKIIDNMGGRIWVESTEGTGSSFFFTVPKPATT